MTEVREADVIVRGDDAVATRDAPNQQRARRADRQRADRRSSPTGRPRIRSGRSSSAGWATPAARRGTAVSYRAPDSFSIARMRRLLDEAIADRPDGLVVSLPDADALAPSIRAAVKAGIPVVTINSGSDEFKSLGVLAHVGQPEYRAGVESGERLGRAGVKRALCVNQESGNSGLDERCRGFADGLRRSGGSIAPAVGAAAGPGDGADGGWPRRSPTGRSTASSRSAPAAPGRRWTRCARAASSRSVTLATFDLSPEVLTAVRDGDMLFAVDQQPYLQGYLPVILLAEQALPPGLPRPRRADPDRAAVRHARRTRPT